MKFLSIIVLTISAVCAQNQVGSKISSDEQGRTLSHFFSGLSGGFNSPGGAAYDTGLQQFPVRPGLGNFYGGYPGGFGQGNGFFGPNSNGFGGGFGNNGYGLGSFPNRPLFAPQLQQAVGSAFNGNGNIGDSPSLGHFATLFGQAIGSSLRPIISNALNG